MLVEDDESHALFVERVLQKSGLRNPLVVFKDGQQAVQYLEDSGHMPNGDGALPALMLLDLHVPGLSGLMVLSWVRERAALKHLPVIMLSGSTESEDIGRAFELGADSYLVKPVAFDALIDTVASLNLSWVVLGRDAVDG